MYSLIYKNSDFIIINKDPGIDFHSKGKQIGLAVKVKKDFPNMNPLPVHRLDKPTDGLIIFANGSKNAANISKLFNNNKVNKFYIAISDAKPKKKQGTIIGDMKRARRGNWKLLKTQINPAVTKFYSKTIEETGYRLFCLKLLTGKTHQIRVALKSLGSPVFGDPRYYKQNLGSDRMYLTAFSMSFRYKNEKFSFHITPNRGKLFKEQSFIKTFAEFQNPTQLKW